MRRRFAPGSALLALATGVVVVVSWSGMVERPGRYVAATALVGLVVALAGALLRTRRLPAYAVATGQLVVAVVGLDVAFGSGRLLGVVPTWGSLRRLDLLVVDGATALDRLPAPVAQSPTATAAMLTACGLAVVLAVDVLAVGLRRPALAALPLLVALAVPISILDAPVSLPVFVAAALLFVRLLATGRPDPEEGAPGRSTSTAGTIGTSGTAGSSGLRGVSPWSAEAEDRSAGTSAVLWQVGVAAVVVALVAAPLVPLGERWRGPGSGPGASRGDGIRLDVVNPLVRLRRDLVEQRHVPLLYARTEAQRTSYLTTTVLDRFTSEDWRPSPRTLPAENSADGLFPNPPGLATTLGSVESQWQLQLAPTFDTTWLPLPDPVRQVAVSGDWRYDSRTLDVTRVGAEATRGLTYSVTAFEPAVTATLLRTALRAPASVRVPMTEVPRDLPPVIAQQARDVTRGARTDYDKAVALQDWFRTGGGFTYSLQQRGGSGMQLLADFVTTDRVGYCEQYAAAMAAMGRTLGIPSRVVVGFLDGERLPDGRVEYTSDARHAWPEMYFSGAGWVRFEPTPASRARTTPAYTRESAAAPSATPTPTTEPTPRATRAPAPAARDTPQSSPTSSHGGAAAWVWPAAAAGGVLLLLTPALLRRRQRRRRLDAADRRHLAEGAWAELRATALDLGLTWPDDRSPREQARSVSEQVEAGPAQERGLQTLLVEVERARYAPRVGSGAVDVVDDATADGLRRTVAEWRSTMEQSVGEGRQGRHGRGRAWRARWLPVSPARDLAAWVDSHRPR